jgi:hypothetical protein
MKHTCPKCRQTINIPERDILIYVERSVAFRARIASLINRINAKKQSAAMTPEQRRERAKNAVKIREEKRAAQRNK